MSEVKNISVEGLEDSPKEVVKTSPVFDVKNYLNDKLEKGETSKELKIRLLTVDKDSTKAFHHIHMHSIRVPEQISKSGWKSYICLEKTEGPFSEELGHKCPFCEMNREMYNKFQEAETEAEKQKYKELSLMYKAREVSIVRCIERGAEEDGPKFWKFFLHSDGSDPEGSIKTLYYTRRDESIEEATEENGGELPEGFKPTNIFDIYNGKDLKITIKASVDKDNTNNGGNNKKTTKKSITVTDYGREKPVTADDELLEKWVNDNKKWFDVFVAKPYDYLKIVMDGQLPWYDKNKGCWVPNEKYTQKTESTNTSQPTDTDEKELNKPIAKKSEPVIEKVSDEDLPF